MNIIVDDSVYNDFEQKERLQKLVSDFSKDLNIKSLSKVIMTNNFKDEVETFQAQNNLFVGIGGENTAGKNIAYIEDGEFKHAIFIRGDTNDYVVHHELAHVHDDLNLYKINGFNSNFNPEDDERVDMALSIWNEYIASRMSASSMSRELFDRYESHCLQLISSISDLLKDYIDGFDNVKAEGYFKKLFVKMLYTYSIILGYTHKNNVDAHLIKKTIKGTELEYYFQNVEDTLKKLYDQYPHWNDLSVLDDLLG